MTRVNYQLDGTVRDHTPSNHSGEHLGPLHGVRIIDMATMMAAPWAAAFLGDFGADVVKIEHPVHGDHARRFGLSANGEPVFWKSLARNKRSVALDLKHPRGREVFLRLVSKSDVVIENFRPGVLDRLDIGYGDLKRANPKIILLSVTGFGQSGPYASRAGFGTLIEAMCGFAHSNGQPDGPPTLPAIPLADGVAGVFGALAVMLALYDLVANGADEGQHIDMSLFEPLARLMEGHMLEYSALGVIRGRMGNASLTSAPRNAYQAGDDKWFAVSASAQPIFERLMTAIGRPEAVDDPRFLTNDDRIANREALDQLIESWAASRTRDDAVAVLSASGAAAGPIYDMAEFLEDPQAVYRGAFEQHIDPMLGPITIPSVFAKFSRTPGRVRHLGQALGESTDEVLRDCGISLEEIEELKAQKVV